MPPKPRVLPPPPRVIPPAGGVTAAPSSYAGSGGQVAPKKETARINILPEPATPRAPTVKMTKTQPLITAPEPVAHHAPVTVAKVAPAAVVRGPDGYLRVDYGRLGLQLITWEEWAASRGERSRAIN